MKHFLCNFLFFILPQRFSYNDHKNWNEILSIIQLGSGFKSTIAQKLHSQTNKIK